MTFWDLGVLVFARDTKFTKCHADQLYEHFNLQMQVYQWRAALSVAQSAECVLALPATDAFNPQSGLHSDTPLTAAHVTPGTIVLALQNAVEQIIDLQSCSAYGLVPDGIWNRHIGSLLKGLVSLGVTIGGSRTADIAIQSLMRDYGDILSECWSI